MQVATYDATRGAEALDSYPEAAAQWAGAHRLVVTKQDAVDPARRRAAAAEAGRINPLAEIVADDDRARAVVAAFAPPRSGAVPLGEIEPGPDGDHSGIRTVLVRPEGPIAADDLTVWLDNLAGLLGDRLLRLKGVVRVADDPAPLLVQSVGTLFAPPRPFRGPDAGNFLVVIARDLAPGELDAVTPRLPVRFVHGGSPFGATPRARSFAAADV